MTNGDLSSILSDIDQMTTRPALALFLGPKIKRFYEQNRVRIESLKNDMQKLIDKHVAKDENKKPQIIVYKDGSRFQFISDGDEREYGEAIKKLMDKGFDVYI